MSSESRSPSYVSPCIPMPSLLEAQGCHHSCSHFCDGITCSSMLADQRRKDWNNRTSARTPQSADLDLDISAIRNLESKKRKRKTHLTIKGDWLLSSKQCKPSDHRVSHPAATSFCKPKRKLFQIGVTTKPITNVSVVLGFDSNS